MNSFKYTNIFRLVLRKLKGYKYDVKYSISYNFPKLDHISFKNDYLALKDGVLDIKEGYAWDGASGPTWDDETNYISSLVHDALYQIMRETDTMGNHNKSLARKYADELLRDMSIKEVNKLFPDDTWHHKIIRASGKLRYNVWYRVVRLLAKRSSTSKQKPRGEIVEIK